MIVVNSNGAFTCAPDRKRRGLHPDGFQVDVSFTPTGGPTQ
jgi:hypothetical protein